MNQKQIIEKYNAYKQALPNEDKSVISTLLLAEVIDNLNISIKRQTWKELASEVSKL